MAQGEIVQDTMRHGTAAGWKRGYFRRSKVRLTLRANGFCTCRRSAGAGAGAGAAINVQQGDAISRLRCCQQLLLLFQ